MKQKDIRPGKEKGGRRRGKSQMGEQNPINDFLLFIYSMHIYCLFCARSHVSPEHTVIIER